MNIIITIVIIASGIASQYAPGVMESVIAVRQAGRTAYTLPAQLPSVDGYIAVLDCAEIGNIWTLRNTESGAVERFLVADCAGDDATREWMQRGSVLVEVDAATARRWDAVGRGVRVERVERREAVAYE